jgi:predicted small integral membrane protein
MAQQLSKSQPKEVVKTPPELTGLVSSPTTGAAKRRERRQGFLPIKTNSFDRGFISVVCFVAIHLLWLRFFEFYLPLWVATILSLVLAVVIIRRG